MRKFELSPGLPGYGTKGNDGSIGLNGVSTYFSSYSGDTDSITIKSKIIANKLLFTTDEYLPNYPIRTYQNGDIFIDKNGQIFEIDFTDPNFYISLGITLNTSGLFEAGSNTSNSPVYTRYSNMFSSSKYLIDVVYVSSTIGNYTSNPTSIYGISALNYAQIKYVDNIISSYQPFTVFTSTNDVTKPEEAIALVKESTKNTWHLGNLDGGGLIRDISLYLDFKDIYIPKITSDLSIYGTSQFYNNVIISQDLSVLNNVYINNDVIISDDIYVKGDASINGYLKVIGDSSINSIYSTINYISKGIEFVSNDGSIFTRNSNTPKNINIYSGNCLLTSGGHGADISIYCGNGGNNNQLISGGGDGGNLSLSGGDGGFNVAGFLPGGNGGNLNISGGNGGYIDSLETAGGKGGTVIIKGGKGGDGLNTAIDSGGNGGDVYIIGGMAGDADSYSGSGGDVYILGGRSYTDTTYEGKIYLGYNPSSTTSSSQTVLNVGTESEPALVFGGELDSGFYRSEANSVSLATAGNEIITAREEHVQYKKTIILPVYGTAPLPTDPSEGMIAVYSYSGAYQLRIYLRGNWRDVSLS